jgi:hypothetical protein
MGTVSTDRQIHMERKFMNRLSGEPVVSESVL